MNKKIVQRPIRSPSAAHSSALLNCGNQCILLRCVLLIFCRAFACCPDSNQWAIHSLLSPVFLLVLLGPEERGSKTDLFYQQVFRCWITCLPGPLCCLAWSSAGKHVFGVNRGRCVSHSWAAVSRVHPIMSIVFQVSGWLPADYVPCVHWPSQSSRHCQIQISAALLLVISFIGPFFIINLILLL